MEKKCKSWTFEITGNFRGIDGNNVEIETVSKLISKPLKEKLKNDAIELNFLKKTTRAKLPL